MTEGARPGITGIHHFSPTVTDVEASVARSAENSWRRRSRQVFTVPRRGTYVSPDAK